MKREENRTGHITSLSLLGGCVLLFTGCISSDLCMVDIPTKAYTEFPYGACRQRVIAVNDGASEFITLTARGADAGLRTFGFDGKEKGFFLPEGLRQDSECFALTENGAYLAYRNRQTRHLYVYNVKTKVESVVYPYISSQWDSVAGIVWLSEEKLLLMLNADSKEGRSRSVIEVLDIITGKKKTVFNPSYINPSGYTFSVSGDKKRVAICDGDFHEVVVRVLEIDTGNILFSGTKGFNKNVCWLQNDDCIGYVAGLKNVKVVSIGDKNEVTLFHASQEEDIVHLRFGEGVFAVNTRKNVNSGQRHSKTTTMEIYDLQTKERIFTINTDFNGEWVVADRGRKIICQIGY